MIPVPTLWPGGTVACLASGPSLTPADVAYVRGKVDGVIVVNTTYQLALWADALVASDVRWWGWHRGAPAFPGLKYATSKHVRWPGVTILRNTGPTGLERDPTGLRHGFNTGYRAINLAVHFGASRILLLGYDMRQGPGGMEHWHGDHPVPSRSVYPTFVRYFRTLVGPLRELGVSVINCTPGSALDCFPRAVLRDAVPVRVGVAC